MNESEKKKLIDEKMKKVVKKMLYEKGDEIANKYVDVVQFGTEGWKLRYYESKFHVSQSDLPDFM